MAFKVIVAGGRAFSDYQLLKFKCDAILRNKCPDVEIVSGGARGADKLGELYSQDRGLPLKVFPADWNQYGRRAGYLRNEQMAEYADALIAFWDGQSRGTKHMIDLAHRYKLQVRVIKYA